MTTRPTPARLARRRSWALPFRRVLGRSATPGRATAPATELPPLSAEDDFLRRLREAGL
jgi:hypothetical protein